MEQNSNCAIVGEYEEFKIKSLVAGNNITISPNSGFPIISNSGTTSQGVENIYQGSGINVNINSGNAIITNTGIQSVVTYSPYLDISNYGVPSHAVISLKTAMPPVLTITGGPGINCSEDQITNLVTITNTGVLDISSTPEINITGTTNLLIDFVNVNNFYSYRIDAPVNLWPMNLGSQYNMQSNTNFNTPFFIGNLFNVNDANFNALIQNSNTILPFKVEVSSNCNVVNSYWTTDLIPNILYGKASLVQYNTTTNAVLNTIQTVYVDMMGANIFTNTPVPNSSQNYINFNFSLFSFSNLPIYDFNTDGLGVELEISAVTSDPNYPQPFYWNSSGNDPGGYLKIVITN